MAEPKTKENDQSVDDFINKIEDETKRKDCHTIIKLMKKATGAKPRMWGDAIVGFGKKFYENKSGGGEWPIIAFSPRKANLVLYGLLGSDELLKKLGKHKTGKSCLYINKLEQIDLPTLKEMIEQAAARGAKKK